MGVPAIANTDEENVEIIQQFMNGSCVLVYGSPECLLSTETVFLTVKASKKMLIGVGISQHCFCRRTVDRKDISTFSISVNTSNIFHPYESNTLSFLFSITRLNGRIRHSLFDLLKRKAKANTIYTRPYLFSGSLENLTHLLTL